MEESWVGFESENINLSLSPFKWVSPAIVSWNSKLPTTCHWIRCGVERWKIRWKTMIKRLALGQPSAMSMGNNHKQQSHWLHPKAGCCPICLCGGRLVVCGRCLILVVMIGTITFHVSVTTTAPATNWSSRPLLLFLRFISFSRLSSYQ